MTCWLAMRNSLECDPLKPLASFKILLRCLRATLPRFTLVIYLEVLVDGDLVLMALRYLKINKNLDSSSYQAN